MHTLPIGRVIYCYDQYQPVYDHMLTLCPDKLEFCHGLPPEMLNALDEPATSTGNDGATRQTIVIMDDMMNKLDMDQLVSLFIKGRHRGLNPILVLHIT